MNGRSTIAVAALELWIVLVGALLAVWAQPAGTDAERDARVQKFLDAKRSEWHDWNVPYEDGKVLHDLILRHHYTRALEIGTSSGHSAIWMAWALSQTGGKLITIEIDETLHRKAIENFKAAGVDAFIDARRADAHRLVKEIEGPFDFVFSDADKDWYTQYFRDVDPKLVQGGCFAAHNVNQAYGGIREFLDYIRSRPDYRTSIDRTSSAGISVSFKK
ncbi:MAG: O-methyltransferase [Hyphomicrobiales bacterium]